MKIYDSTISLLLFHPLESLGNRVISAYFISFFIVLHWVFDTHQKQIDVIHTHGECECECDETESFTTLRFGRYWKGFSSGNSVCIIHTRIALGIVLIQQQKSENISCNFILIVQCSHEERKKPQRNWRWEKCTLIFYLAQPPHFFLWALYYVNK